MRECYGCFKPARDPTACTTCTYIKSHEMIESLARDLPPELRNLPPEVLDEARYELQCHLPQFKTEEAKQMMQSGLATIIGKCADTACYLSKKRHEDLDDLKVILFDVDHNEATITNGDVIVRISDIHPDVLCGLNPDIPAYDYIAERFIPNPLPYSKTEMAQAFFNEFSYSFVLPLPYLLDQIYRKYQFAVERRSVLAVLDVGYGMSEGSLLIPQFDKSPAGTRIYKYPQRDTFGGVRHSWDPANTNPIIVLEKDSVVPDEAILDNTPYVAVPMAENKEQNVMMVNVYKRYGGHVVLGMYKIMSPALSDDIHPHNLESYAENDRLVFKLMCPEISHNRMTTDVMEAFRTFRPVTIELDYLFHILLLLGSFGFQEVAFNIRNTPEEPILIEGIRCLDGQPTIEAVVSTVEIGQSGRRCEEMLAGGV